MPPLPSHYYWNGNGKHQDDYEQLWAVLVPNEGPAETRDGELLRCVTKLYIRYHNDGDTYGAFMDRVWPRCDFAMQEDDDMFFHDHASFLVTPADYEALFDAVVERIVERRR